MHWLYKVAGEFAISYLRKHLVEQRQDNEIMYWSLTTRPQDSVGRAKAVGRKDRELVVSVLRKGKVVESYLGWADCRICGVMLGTHDVGSHGFVWPEKADHYITEHNVWTPGLDALCAAVKTSRRT